nr:AAA family ATPase [Desulfopila sp. IMCC35008]
MKILQVRLRNLNSLAGDWFIDFTSPEIRNSGIFAITGPTGAGKSTILDGICLALYGKTPRLGPVNKSSNEIMTRHTGECFAEIEFLTGKGRYRCHWSQHRARKSPTGDLQQQKHEIVDALSGKVIESKLKLVEKKVIEVTGLDFEQFTRSILLAQGDFNIFLKSGPDKRAPILEQITGTSIYSKISLKVHELTVFEEKKRDQLQLECDGFLPMTEEQRVEIDSKLAELNNLIIDQEQKINQHRQILNWYTEQEKLQQKITTLEQAERELTARSETLKPEKERYLRALQAQKLEPDYHRLRDTEDIQNEEVKNLTTFRITLKHITEELTKTNKVTKRQIVELQESKKSYLEKQKLFADVRRIDQEIAHTSKLIKESEHERNKVQLQCTGHQKRITAIEKDITTVANRLAVIQNYYEQNKTSQTLPTEISGIREHLANFNRLYNQLEILEKGIDANSKEISKNRLQTEEYTARATELNKRKTECEVQHTFIRKQWDTISIGRTAEQIHTDISDLQQKLTTLDRILEADQLAEKIKQDLKTLLAETESCNSQKQRLVLHKEQLVKEKLQQKTLVEKQEKIVFLASQIKNFELERNKLKEGNPCPLCGSSTHPYCQNQVNYPQPDEEEQKLTDERNKLEAIQEQFTTATANVAEYTTRSEQLIKNRQEKEQEQQQQITNRKTLQQKLQHADTNSTETVKQLVEATLSKRDELLTRLENLKKLENRDNELIQISQEIEKKLTETEKALAVSSKHHETLTDERKQLHNDKQNTDKQLTETSTNLGILLKPFTNQPLSYANTGHILTELEAKDKQWQEHTKNLSTLSSTLQQHRSDRDKFAALHEQELRKCTELDKKISEHVRQLRDNIDKRNQLFGEDNPDRKEAELQHSINMQEKRLEKFRQKTETCQHDHARLSERVDALHKSTAAREELLIKLRDTFRTTLLDNSFADKEDFISSLLSEQEVQDLARSLAAVEDEMKNNRALLTSSHKALQHLQNSVPTDTSKDKILEFLTEGGNRLASLQQDKGAYLQQLSDNNRLIKQHGEKIEQLAAQQRIYERWLACTSS